MSETSPLRPGEEIDIGRLTGYLQGRLGRSVGRVEVEQFPAGSSNLTYLVRVETDEYVLRRPPFGNTVKTAHDMRREFDVLSKLSNVYKPAPRPLIFCDDDSVIGSEFYLMERRHGLIIRGRVSSPHGVSSPHVSKGSTPAGSNDYPPNRPITAADLESSQPARLAVCRSFVQNLAELHTLDFRQAGLGSLGHIEGYNRRQVEGWSRRYFAARTDDHPEIERTIGWLNERIPPESGGSLVHNDYKFDNIMLDPADLTRITAVLDWEMVTVGEPLMDLGTSLGYWMSGDSPDELLNMPFNPRVMMENVSRRDLVRMYSEALGREMPDILYYYVFGTFKIAVIAQQIYARFVRGSTSDPRFASFNKFVRALGIIAKRAIRSKTI